MSSSSCCPRLCLATLLCAYRGALESAGLLGSGPGQIKPHRALFCSTLEGKNSMVRQLDAQLHIDGHPSTVSFAAAGYYHTVHRKALYFAITV